MRYAYCKLGKSRSANEIASPEGRHCVDFFVLHWWFFPDEQLDLLIAGLLIIENPFLNGARGQNSPGAR